MFQKLFGGGAPDPREISVADAAAAMQANPDLQVIDCREPYEWAQAHIPGSTLVPLGELGFRMKEFDQTRPVIVVCMSGSRSLAATGLLTQRGFTDVKSMAGGLVAWAGANQPLTR